MVVLYWISLHLLNILLGFLIKYLL